MARDRNVRFRIGATDDTGRATRSAAQNFRRLGTTAKIAIGNFASGAVLGALNAIRNSVRGIVDEFDRAQKLGQVLDLDPSVVRNFQLLGQLIGTNGERLARLARRLRDVASGAGEQRQRDALEALGLNLQEIQNSSADETLLKFARALRAVGDSAAASGAASEVVGDRLAESSLLLSANLEEAQRILGRGGSEELDRATRAVAAFNDAQSEASAGLQNNIGRALAAIQEELNLTDGEFRVLSKNLSEASNNTFIPFTGILGTLAVALKDYKEEVKELNEVTEEQGDLATFAYEEAPLRGRIILRQSTAERKKAIEDEKKAEKELEDQRKKAADDRRRQREQDQAATLRGLQAIIDLEGERGRASFGVTGQDVPVFSQPPSPAQALLNQATQQQQLQAIRELVKIAKARPGNFASFF